MSGKESSFHYVENGCRRWGSILDDLSVRNADWVVVGSVAQSMATGRWHGLPDGKAFGMKAVAPRTWSARSGAARWLCETHAVSKGWAA